MDILASVVRTVVPLVIGYVITWASQIGFTVSEDQSAALAALLTGVISAIYYAIVRFLETNYSDKWGWLLGWATAPTYTKEDVAPAA